MLAMIITCPHCTTRYSIAATAFGATARTVRCSNCSHLWTVQPPQLNEAGDRAAQQPIAPVATPSTRRQTGPRRVARLLQEDRSQDPREAQRTTHADRVLAERPEERNKQPDAEAAPRVGAPPTGDQVPSLRPAPAPGGDRRAATSEHRSAGRGGAAKSDERSDQSLVAAEEAATATVSQELALEFDHRLAGESAGETADQSVSQPAPKAAARRRGRAVFVALAATVLVVGLGILVVGRDVIMAAASSLSAMVGLQEPPGAGLDIGGVTSFRQETADGDVLVVEGTVTYVTDYSQPLPLVRES